MIKIYKILLILFVNLILLILLILLSDFIIYKIDSNPDKFLKNNPLSTEIPKFRYNIKDFDIVYLPLNDYYDGSNDIFKGRKPVGLEYCKMNKNCSYPPPIIIFGDSFAHGQYLKFNQNFSYKLSQTLKRPVYNRAIPGSGVQHMFYQVSDKDDTSFYEEVQPSDTVFYILIDDHYLRMSILSDFDTVQGNIHLRYTKNRRGELVKDNYKNVLLNIIKSSPTIKAINLKYLDNYIKNPKNADKLTDMLLLYFIQTRKILENKWNKKIKFIVIFYDNRKINHKEILRKKLEENNFIVLDTSELTSEDLNSEEYLMQDNLHPKEKAWDLLTPIIINKLKRINVL